MDDNHYDDNDNHTVTYLPANNNNTNNTAYNNDTENNKNNYPSQPLPQQHPSPTIAPYAPQICSNTFPETQQCTG